MADVTKKKNRIVIFQGLSAIENMLVSLQTASKNAQLKINFMLFTLYKNNAKKEGRKKLNLC